MGSKVIQSHLWGQRPQDWAKIQEPTGLAGYNYVLNLPQIKSAKKLLDVGCGSGYFCNLAHKAGIDVTGMDATAPLLDEAKKRDADCAFVEGEMESLPFEDNAFDVVCGFNSFQYAANVPNALAEARRVLKPGGTITAMVWGPKEDCEAGAYLKAVGSLLPPPPPGAPGPFALSEPDVLKNVLADAGFTQIEIKDIPAIWNFPDTETAMKGLLSAGPAAKAIENSGFDKAHETVLNALSQFTKPDGRVVFNNKYRIAVAKI